MSVPVFTLGGLLLVLVVSIIAAGGALTFFSWLIGCFTMRQPDSRYSQPPSLNGTLRALLGVALLAPVLLAGMLFIRSERQPHHVQILPTIGYETVELPPAPQAAPLYPTGDAASVQNRLAVTMRNLREARQTIENTLREHPEIRLADNPESAATNITAELDAESAADASVVTLKLSARAIAELAAGNNAELLRSLNAILPDRLKQAYGLIPLSAPGIPLPSGSQSVVTAETLQQLAAVLSTTMRRSAETNPDQQFSQDHTASDVEVPGLAEKADSPANELAPPSVPGMSILPTAVVQTDEPRKRDAPTWLKKPDAGRVVVETSFIPASDDTQAALAAAVGEALQQHLIQQTARTLKPATDWSRLISLNLSDKAVQTCVVETYEREEVIETREGQQPMKKTYALVEFPETVDNAALLTIRQSVQRQRMGMIATALGLLWLAMLTTGLIIRLATGGSRWRRTMAVIAIILIPLPLLMATTGVVIGGLSGEVFEFPWQSLHQPVMVNVSRG